LKIVFCVLVITKMNVELTNIETELKKRLTYPYKWGRKQNNEFDKLTNFIYRTFLFDDIIKEINSRFKKDKEHQNISNYALNLRIKTILTFLFYNY